MSNKIILSLANVDDLARAAARLIVPTHPERAPRVYAIPRGGIPAAMAIRHHVHFDFVDEAYMADYVVDDLIDSGETMQRVLGSHPQSGWHRPVPVVLINKPELPEGDKLRGWIVFPWEGDEIGSFEDNVRRMLQFIGEDAERGGLEETPARVAKAWSFWCKGYNETPEDILKVFEDGAQGVNEMVMVKDIPFYTHCEHHMAPFFGTATIAYIPDGKIVGLSKLPRLLDCFARRLQVQERLTTQVADAIMEHLKPKGVGVIINARHLCMESRGICKQGSSTTTSALRGVMLEGVPRAEFLSLAK